MYGWLHRLRLWLWQRQVRTFERSIRPTGTTEGDWIAATVASSAGSSGFGAAAYHTGGGPAAP